MMTLTCELIRLDEVLNNQLTDSIFENSLGLPVFKAIEKPKIKAHSDFYIRRLSNINIAALKISKPGDLQIVVFYSI